MSSRWVLCYNYNGEEDIVVGEKTTYDAYSSSKERVIGEGVREFSSTGVKVDVTRVSERFYYLSTPISGTNEVIAVVVYIGKFNIPQDLDAINKKRLAKSVLQMAGMEELTTDDLLNKKYMDDKIDTWIDFDMI